MKMKVIHDKTGKIRSAGVVAPEFEGQVQLVPGKNQRVADVNTSADKSLADLRLVADRKQAARVAPVWREFSGAFRIDSKGTLLRKKTK